MTRPRPLRLAGLLVLGAALVAGGLTLLPISRTHAALSHRAARGPHGPRLLNSGEPFLQAWRPEVACRFPADAFAGVETAGPTFHCSPLQLDGRALDWDAFSIESRGTLRVVHGDPRSPAATPIRFRVRLRRDGRIVEDARSRFLNQASETVDLGDIMAVACQTDELVVEPVEERDWRATRVVPLSDC